MADRQAAPESDARRDSGTDSARWAAELRELGAADGRAAQLGGERTRGRSVAEMYAEQADRFGDIDRAIHSFSGLWGKRVRAVRSGFKIGGERSAPSHEAQFLETMDGIGQSTLDYLISREAQVGLGPREISDLAHFGPDQAAAIQQEVLKLFQATPDTEAPGKHATDPIEQVYNTGLEHTKLVFIYGDVAPGMERPLLRIALWRQRDVSGPIPLQTEQAHAPTETNLPRVDTQFDMRATRTDIPVQAEPDHAPTVVNMPIVDTQTDLPAASRGQAHADSGAAAHQEVQVQPAPVELDLTHHLLDTQDIPVNVDRAIAREAQWAKHDAEYRQIKTKGFFERPAAPGGPVAKLYQESIGLAERISGRGRQRDDLFNLIERMRERSQAVPEHVLPDRLFKDADEQRAEGLVAQAMSRAVNALNAGPDVVPYAVLLNGPALQTEYDRFVMDEILTSLGADLAPSQEVHSSVRESDGKRVTIEVKPTRVTGTWVEVEYEEADAGGSPGMQMVLMRNPPQPSQ